MATDVTLSEQLWFEIRKAATVMERQAEAVVKAEVGVSLGLFMALSVLEARNEPVSQQAIADRLGLTKGTVSRLLDTARSEGYVSSEVAAASRRERAVTLTSSGRLVVERGDAALAASDLTSYAVADSAGAQAVIDGLRVFTKTLTKL